MNKLIVEDKYRTNELSLVPGGYDVEVLDNKEATLVYTKVKNPEAYCRHLNNVVSFKILGESK